LYHSGQAPFKVEYSVSRDLHSVKHDSIPSAYTSVKVPLKTDEPGAYTYVFEKIGDANYDPRPEGVQGASSKSGKLILKQEVRERPSASFGTSSDAPISLCSRSLLNPTTSGGKALIQFRGQAPFDVTLHLHLDESSQPAVRHIKGVQSPWKIDLPDFEFEHVGMYRIKIASVSDASGCDRKEREQDVAELRVEVAETASVIPLIKTRDVCVGQQLDFLLQGTKPWNLV
jgi:nucleoporin POM152